MRLAYAAAAAFLIISGEASAKCGIERWPVKTGTDADAASVNLMPQDATIAQLGAIAAPASMRNRFAPVELMTYQVRGTLILIKHEEDGDYHIVLRDGDSTMIVESPDPACARGSVFEKQIGDTRAAINTHFGNVTGRKANLSIPVVATGIGFFDKCHGQEGRATNCIELHPLLKLEFAQ